MAISIPLFAIAAVFTGLPGIIAVCVALVAIAIVSDARRLVAGRDLLQRPPVAVGIAEADERAPRQVLDVADLHAALDSSARAASASATTICRPCTEPGGVSVMPVPMAIEHAEPGGVSCTKRRSSLTWWSWSASNPTWST